VPAWHRRLVLAVDGRAGPTGHNRKVTNQGAPPEVGISAREGEVLAALGEHLTNGRADIVGFGNAGVYTAVGQGDGTFA
jgi:hypothetical protein